MERVSGIFTVPACYRQFRCKGGECRHNCCQQLAINMSREEYFRLVGMECSPELRRRLDLSLKQLQNADPFQYACISPDFFGRCRMLDSDGLCLLQKEGGADALCAACRYFPRRPKTGKVLQCSTVNACEKTLELLREGREPLAFEELPLEFYLDGRESAAQREEELFRIQMEYVRIMTEDSGLFLAERLGKILEKAGSPMKAEVTDSFLEDLKDLLLFASREYPALHVPAETAVLRMVSGFGPEQYLERKAFLFGKFPGIGNFFIRMLGNDMFCRSFPFGDPEVDSAQAAEVLAYAAGQLILLCETCLNETDTEEDLIDLCAAFFRMTELTAYDRNAMAVIKNRKSRD